MQKQSEVSVKGVKHRKLGFEGLIVTVQLQKLLNARKMGVDKATFEFVIARQSITFILRC